MTAPPIAAPVAFVAGVRAVTVGAVLSAAAPVVKVQDVTASALLAASLMPSVNVAVYWVPDARFADGSRVATRVVAL